MNNITLTAETPFYQSINYDHDARRAELATEQAYRDVWLYERDEEARKRVDADTNAAMYVLPSMKDKKGMALWAREHARLAAPRLADTPVELAQGMRDRLPDESMRQQYTARMQELESSGQDSADDWYSLYAGMYRDAVVRGHEEREKKKQDLQRELDEVQGLLADALPRYALGEDLSPELMDRMQKYGRPDEVFPSLKRARAAVELVRGWNYGGRSKADYEGAVQARFERLRDADVQPVTSGGNLVSETKLQRMHTDDELMQQARADEGESYAVTREQMATLADVLSGEDGQLDEGALGAFLLAIDADAQGQQTVDSRFVRNAVEAMKGSLMGAVDYLNRGAANTGMIWQGPDMPPIYLDAEGRESYARAYSDNVETLRGHLAQLEGRRLDAAEKAKLHSWLLTKGGTIVGENVPYLVAGAVGKAAHLGVVGTAALGGLVNAPASMNRSIGQAYAEGKKNAEFVGSVKGLAQSWAEAAFVPLPGGTAIVNGALDSLARKAISLPGAGKVIGAVWGNGLLRYVSTTTGASAGELLGEEVLAQTVQYPVLAFARAAGMDLDAPEWQPFADSWRVFNDDPRQAAATVVYCALMGAAGAPANVQAARDFAKEYRNLMAAGLKPESARRLSMQAGQAASPEDMEALCADMQETYRREVREGDPVAVQKRLRREGESFLEEVEVQMYARSGVRDYVLKRAGILAGEKTAAGLNRISLPNKETPDKPTVLEWTDEQLNAWVEMQHESKVVETMRELQARVAGAALGDAAVDEADFKGVLVNLRELPVRALARMERTGGRVTYDVLKDLAADAREQVAGFVEGGMSEHEAYQQMSEIPGVRLGTLVNAAEGFTQRVEAIVGTPEGAALGITRPEDASTSVFRLNGVAPGQSVLLFNKGLATEREMVEDLIERDVIAATSGEHAVTTLAALEKMLRRVQSHLVRYEGGMRLLPKDKAASEMDIVEAFSKLAQSRFLLNHEQYSMPREAHDTIEYVQKKLAHTQHLVALSRAWDAFARSEEGRAFIEKEGATLEKLMSDAGASVAGQYSRARFGADAFEAVRRAYEMSVASPEAAQETLREYEAEQQELDHPQEQEGSIPASITGEALPLFDSEPVNQETGEQQLQPGEAEMSGGNLGRSLAGERYVEVGDGSVLGVAEVEGISLSSDVPQFKKKESAAGRVEADEDGTTHELAGGWNANSAPIHVWRRTDGRLEVISGRHRLAHARRNGVKFIQVRVYDESAGRDAAWAKLHDVEQNILDNTCNAIDVAYYFRHNPLTMAEAEARGLLPKTRAGEQTAASRIGLTVAARASEDTFALLVNGRCTADDAYMACLIASTEDGQRLALETRAGKNGKKNGWEYVTALVRGAEQMQPETGGMLDLFGNDDSFRESSEKLARYVAAVREGLKARIAVFVNSSKLNRKADVAKELGVKVNTPEDATRLISRLANLDAAYERLDPDLGIPAKAEAWDGKSAVPTKLDELAAGSSYSLGGVMTPEMEGIKAAAVKNGTFMKAPNGKPTKLTERQWLQVRTGAFKGWFGDWEKVARFNSAVQQLRSMSEVTSITGTEFAPDGRKLTDKVTEFWNKEYGGVAKNPVLGDVVLDARSVKASIAHGVGRLKSAAFAVVHDVIEQGVLVEIAPDWKGRGEDSYVIAAPVQIGNTAYVCEVVVMKGETRTGFYLHEVQIKEKLLDVFKTGVVTGTSGAPKSILLDVWQRVKQIEENCSKVVDENGEPLVVYHGSLQWFQVFNNGNERHQSGAPDGTIFANDNREIAVSFVDYYGGKAADVILDENDARHARMSWGVYRKGGIYPLFMNLRNPLVVDFKGMTWHGEKYDIKDVNWYAEEARKSRHDGLIARNVIDVGFTDTNSVPPSTDYVAFDSTQVKSATDNRGSFDGSNPDITFSVIGPKAKTWDKYKDRAFTGRDDGMLRAEIDASGAKLKWEDLRGKNVAAYRKLVAEWDELPEEERKALVTFSIQSIMTDWSTELDNFVQNPPVHKSAAWDADVYVCPTPAVMQMVGALPRDMVMSHHVLAKVLDEHTVLGNGQTTGQMYGKEKDMGKHQLTVAELRKLPLALANPVCIAVSNHKGSIEVITDMEENGINVLVAVRLDASLRSTPKLVVNRITSLYGKKKIEQLVKHPMLYVNTAKAHRWMVDRGLQLPTVTKLSAGSTGRILTPEDLVKYKFATGQSFSLSGRGMIDAVDLGVMAREGQMQRLVSHARREAARWERTFAKDTPNAKAAEAMGTISSIQAAILRVLPPKYRPALAAQMRYVEVYARMLESGRVSAKGKLSKEERAELLEQMEAELGPKMEGLKADAARELKHLFVRDWGEANLAQAAARMLNDAADAVERWMIDVELERVERMKERLAPRKLPNGKYDKGKMSAGAYKEFVRFCGLMELDADTVAEKLHDLEALIAAEEGKDEPDADRLDKLVSQMAELAAYGNLKGKSLEAVRRGVAALRAFVRSERNVWQGKLERERERAKRAARVMAELMGPGDEVKLAENAEKSEETLRMFGDMGAGFKSLAQMFYGMGGIPGLRDLTDESLEALAHGHVQLGMREQRAYDQLGEFLEKQLGLDTEAKRNDWMARLKKRVDTKVQRAGELVVHKLELTREEAESWLELDKEEREEKRRKMLDAAEKSGVDAVNVVYEEDIPLLRDELAKFDDLPGKRKFIRTERSWRKVQAGNIVASRDEILNILLLCEQAEYQQTADENGYTAEVLAKLREVVGEDVMAFGHEMRRVLEGSGLAAVYEAREGIPFPAVQNYWPGKFDLSAKMNEQANALDPTTGTGTRYGMLITRVKHKLKFNLNLGASNVFLAALAQQNNYICMGELTARWRRLLSHSNFAMSLKQRLGDKQFKQLKELLNLLDGAGIAESVTQQGLSSMLARFQSAHAMAVLAGSPITLIKQTSAMLHAGAWEGISPWRVLWHLLKDRAGKGAITYGEIKEMDAFKVRHRDNRYFPEFMQLGRNANWSKLSTWARTGMGWIEKMDIACNAASMTALYNIKYEQLQEGHEGAADPLSEEEMRSICAKTVEQALELAAQPQRRTQKSAMAALSRNALVRSACYMSSESLNKIGMYAAIKQRNGGGMKGRVAALKFLLPMSIAQQATVMALDMLRGTAPGSDDDEWAEWFWLNVATGCSGLGMLQSVPMLGELVGWATGGYVKTSSLGEMLFDFRGAARSFKRIWKMSTDDKDYRATEWMWQLMNAGRIMTAGTGFGRGINSTSKVFSEVSGGLQSLNAVVNHVRPVIQGARNREEK